MWKQSRFNIYFQNPNGDTLIINTLRRGIASVSSYVASHIQQHAITDVEFYDLNLTPLCENGMIVPVNTDELRNFTQWYERIGSNLYDVRCTIALTSSCNLNCAYCFETGALRAQAHTMTENISTAVVEWLESLARHEHTQNIRIVFYGGEPTIAYHRMLHIAESTRNTLSKQVNVTFGIYTNGVDFNEELIKYFSSPDFQWAQIALDGPQDIHDKRRCRINGQGTFKNIWKNIGILVDECRVHVRIVVNFDKDNYSEIPTLLKQIAESKWHTKVEVAFNPIFDTGLNRKYCITHNFPQHETFSLWRALYEKALELGLNTPFLRMIDKGPCAIHRAGNLYISPEGALYECIGLLGMETHRTGSVLEPFSSDSLIRRKKWIAINTKWPEECQECSLLPLCLGGCRFKAFCESGDLKGWICHRDLIEICELPLAFLASEMNRTA